MTPTPSAVIHHRQRLAAPPRAPGVDSPATGVVNSAVPIARTRDVMADHAWSPVPAVPLRLHVVTGDDEAHRRVERVAPPGAREERTGDLRWPGTR